MPPLTPSHLVRPHLIPLEPRLVELEDGSRGVALRDPLAVVETVVVTPPAYAILVHLDGQRTVREVAAAVAAAGLPGVRDADVARMVELADGAGLLHGPAHELRRAARVTALRAGPREPACAGAVYPEEPAALRDQLARWDAHAEGPGSRAGPPPDGGVRLLVAPHIDYARGAASYAHAYRALEGCDADLFVVLGTAHASPRRLFTLTRQDYATPLGPVTTDRALVNALVAELGEDELLGDELVHVNEHSCELQMVWLRHVLGDRPVRALPVLCSSISHLDDPAAATDRFLDALGRHTAGRSVCYVAGADLAHVGPQYGDERPPTRSELAALAEEDRRSLAFVERGDAAGFHRDATRDDDRRRLCGVAPLYAALRASGRRARLLHYGQWTDGIDSVSYAAMVG